MPLAAPISAACTARSFQHSMSNAPLRFSARPSTESGPVNSSSSCPQLLVGSFAFGDEAADERRDAMLLGFGQADPELEAEWLRDLVGEEGAEAPAVDAPDDLADEPSVGERVVAVRRPRLPDRLLHRRARR